MSSVPFVCLLAIDGGVTDTRRHRGIGLVPNYEKGPAATVHATEPSLPGRNKSPTLLEEDYSPLNVGDAFAEAMKA